MDAKYVCEFDKYVKMILINISGWKTQKEHMAFVKNYQELFKLGKKFLAEVIEQNKCPTCGQDSVNRE